MAVSFHKVPSGADHRAVCVCVSCNVSPQGRGSGPIGKEWSLCWWPAPGLGLGWGGLEAQLATHPRSLNKIVTSLVPRQHAMPRVCFCVPDSPSVSGLVIQAL